MSSIGRWVKRILLGLVALIGLAVAAIYVISGSIIGRTYAVRTHAVTVPTDSVALARGEHLARVSCFGCHSDSLRGRMFFDQSMVARIVAPNAVERLATYSDAEFAGFLRSGVHRDGTASFIMPPPGFYHMSDADLGALIAFLRRQPKASSPALPSTSYGLLGRMGIAMGEFKNAVAMIDTTVPRVGDDPAVTTTRKGEYLARMICVSCHGAKLTGDPGPGSPSIVSAVGYSEPDFFTLLRTGTPRAGSAPLAMMGDVARSDLTNLSDDEISAVYAYLRSLPQTGVPGVK